MLQSGMVQNRDQLSRHLVITKVILDDRSRLPGRFFGRLTTAALIA